MGRISAISLMLLVFSGLPALAGYDLTPQGNIRYLADFAAQKGVVKLPDGLMYKVLDAGTGPGPLGKQDLVDVEYRGMRIDGRVFDATKPGQPHTFQVGGVIPGWSEILRKMKTGDQWVVVIPADLAYGAQGVPGAIPPNQTLVFVIKLDKVEYQP